MGARGADSRRRILVVDDNEDAAEALIIVLGELGHDASAANDGGSGRGRASCARTRCSATSSCRT
jgi:CheY-like chemotaxis protein